MTISGFSLSSSRFPVNSNPSRFPRPPPSPSSVCCVSRSHSTAPGPSDLHSLLHDAMDSSGLDTTHARAAREGFCSQIRKLSAIEKQTSIAINRGVDLGKTALYIAAEDDSLVSHSSVPLPVDDFLERLDDLSMGYCVHYSSSLRESPELFLSSLEQYLYVNKAFRRADRRNHHLQQQALYLHSALTHRSGSAPMLSLIYSEVLKILRLWGLLNFDAEIFFPHDSYSSPRGYHKQKSKDSDELHIMTPLSLLVEMLRDLKDAFWPFQIDHTKTLFLRAAKAANCTDRSNYVMESGLELASAKAAQHRLDRGVWTSVWFGDMRRALSACERLILLDTDPNEVRDYSILLYHCALYNESLHHLKSYIDMKNSLKKQLLVSSSDMEDDALEKLMNRLNLILMEGSWSRPSHSRNFFANNSEPW